MARSNERTQFWGESTDQKGHKIQLTISAPNVYDLTVMAAIKITKYCIENNVAGGYYTPSMLLGSDFISTMPDVEIVSSNELN
jgi:short subunit dehydrogenase-like uncharacterized protein